MIKRIFR